MTRRLRRRAVAALLGLFVLLAGDLCAADDLPGVGGATPAPVLRELTGLRRLTECAVAPTDDQAQERAFQGRPSIEIRGRARGDGPTGALRDLAVFDPAAGRIVSYVCFVNTSTRTHGEAILSLAAISSRADQLAPALFPGSKLELESVQRYKAGETDRIYYEARYTSTAADPPFFESPVRVLLNGSTGSFFRLDIDPDWFDPPAAPRVLISRKAAERLATVVLQRRDLASAFGAGAVLGKVAAAEMFTVHPNDSFGFFPESDGARARVAWVVPFRVDGSAAGGLHTLFVDAATGRILGGVSGQAAGPPPR